MNGVIYRALFLLRTKLGPPVLFAGTVAAAWWVWQDVGQRGAVVGFAEGEEVRIGVVSSGLIQSIEVQVGQAVEAGQLIARIDPLLIETEIRTLEAERDALEASIKTAEAEARAAASEEARRLATDAEQAEVELSNATATARSKAAELKALGEQRRKLAALHERRMASEQDLAELDTRHAALKRETAEAERALTVLAARLESSRKRFETGVPDLAAVSSEPLRKELSGVVQRIADLQAQVQQLDLRSPIRGTVASVLAREGEVAQTGVPVATVVGSATGRVIACVTEDQAMAVQVGEAALLWPKDRGGEPLRGRTASVSPMVSLLPERCWRMPRMPAWGRELVIHLDAPGVLVSGQAFDVRLGASAEPRSLSAALPEPAPPALPAPTQPGGDGMTPPPAAAPRAMTVPPSLRQQSRFEPSGLLWVEGRSRYVVVSDDTGTKEAADHAPWIFTMDEDGNVDPRPLIVEGLTELNDLESVADAGDGALWVMAAQSQSKKGKRPASRQLFARLVPHGDGYRVAASTRFYQWVAALPARDRAGLGLDAEGALDAFNIEGMTRDGDGLLLGLKAPLDGEGRALIWRVGDPDALVGGKGPAGVSLYGRLRLAVTADGREAPGGIADLLRLPDGRLLVAATASGTKTLDQSGSLWLTAAPPEPGGEMEARQIRVFPGLKPEGLALSPSEGRVTIVFDRDAETPAWLEMPWPR